MMRWAPLLSLALALAPAADAWGQVTVTDGDSLVLSGKRIRLHGIDAPELRQSCADGWPAGALARAALAAVIDRRPVECSPVTLDRYGRTVARCTAGGRDLGAAMVAAGMAYAFTRYSVEYEPQERAARARGLGVHVHPCGRPEAYRRR